MMLLLLVFGAVFLLCFGGVVVASAPSAETKVFQSRIDAIAARQAGGEAPAEAMQLLRKQQVSRFGWIEQLLNHYAPMQRFRRFVMQSGVKTDPTAILVQSLVLAAVGYVAVMFFTHTPPLGIAGIVVLGALPLAWVAWSRHRRVKTFEDSLAQAIDMVARSLRAGHSIASAFELVAQGAPEPAKSEFAEVFRQQNFGIPLRDALLQMLDRVPSQDLRVMITGIIVQRETGGNLVEILDRTVFVIRERQRIRGEIRTQTAQGRLTGWILTLLPVIMLLLINLMDPGYSKPLLHDPTGEKMMYAGIAMIVLGGFLINRIINSIDI
ncbi:MAG TPA: type II secretion system F family protein [Acidobacteriaceae bacterium]|nr:type II secretion system F family protein [Acidobacteriaceae bacterium]